MADVDDLLKTITSDVYWTQLRADFDGASVQWRSWSTRNPFLTVSRFTTFAAAAARDAVRVIAAAGFLDFATALGLTLFARSQYQLDRQVATFATGRIVLDMSPVVAPAPVTAGNLQAGTPGPITAQSKIFTSLEDATLRPGEANVLRFTAQGSGDSYNLPVNAPIELKTSIPGVIASLRASGPPLTIGLGNASILVYAAAPDVTIRLLNPLAPNATLDVVGNLNQVTVFLSTDGASVLNATAAQVRQKIADAINVPALNVAPLLVAAALGGDGTGVMQALPVTALEWTGTWIETYGQNDQSDPNLTQDCRNRFPTLGGASGDGAPVSTAQSESALAFWGKQPPIGYTRSLVEKIRVYTNIDDTGAVDGAAALVIIAGASGPLPLADVTAVAGNFENPQKYSYGITLRTISAVGLSVLVTGTVTIRRSSGRSIAEVQAAVAAAITAHQADPTECDIGSVIDHTKISAVIIDADRAAIQNFTRTAPLAPVALTFKQVAVFDIGNLIYVLV